MKDLIEYKVRLVTRYIVTRFSRTGDVCGCEQKGEFDNESNARAVAYALCKDEHERLGWEPGDIRIRYPDPEPIGSSDFDSISEALDALAMALPDGFHWPQPLRARYERAHQILIRLKTHA